MKAQLLPRFISLVSDPLVVSPAAVFMLLSDRGFDELLLTLLFVVCAGALPVLALLFEYFDDSVSATNRVTRVERNLVYKLALAGLFVALGLFQLVYQNDFWVFFTLIVIVYFALTLFVNVNFDKASQHIGFFTFWSLVLATQVSIEFAILLVATPLVAWSRITLKYHSGTQVLWGLGIGLTTGLLTLLIV